MFLNSFDLLATKALESQSGRYLLRNAINWLVRPVTTLVLPLSTASTPIFATCSLVSQMNLGSFEIDDRIPFTSLKFGIGEARAQRGHIHAFGCSFQPPEHSEKRISQALVAPYMVWPAEAVPARRGMQYSKFVHVRLVPSREDRGESARRRHGS